jgi:hypothetical protein
MKMLKMRNVLNVLKRITSPLLALAIVAGPAFAAEPANLVINVPNVTVRMYGFVENDLINDSTQGAFKEEMDNNTIAKASTYAGQHHQTIMSVRNSRLGFDFTFPKTDFGLDTEAVMEMDFLGNVAAGTAERDTFNNPAVRIRHAFINMTDGQWNVKMGQTWSLLGWQPYYFPSEAIIQPAVGQLYRRFTQVRATNTQKLGEDWTFETALDAARPAEIDSGNPIYQGGLRIASTKYKAAAGIGSGIPLVGLSLGLSGDMIPYRTAAYGSKNGSAVAADLLIPIIPSSDGKDPGNNLSLTAEYANGTGIGGLELAGLTGGISSVTDGVSPATGVGSIDSGEAAVVGGQLDLPHFQSYRANLTYILPGARWSTSGGYADVLGLNMADYGASTSLVPHMQYYFVNAMYMPLKWLRFALELAQTKDTYNDAANRFAYNTRIHFTTYITF